MRILNYIAIIMILAAVVIVLWRYYKYLTRYSDLEFESSEDTNIASLVKGVNETFSEMQKKNLQEMNLSRKDYERRLKSKAELRNALQEAAYGNKTAKQLVKGYIRDIIQEPRFGINEGNINSYIPFHSAALLSGQDKFEILMYLYKKKYGENAFEHLMRDTGLSDPVLDDDGNEIYDVTKERLDKVYAQAMAGLKRPLSYSDKLEVLTQRIFESFKGFGAADLLFESKLDEIDAGVSGIPKGGFDIDVLKGVKYSYDSIWVLFHGINIHLSCIGFGSQEELIRVCNNVYKYQPPHMLSIKDPKIVTTMKDGSRVVVARPPAADSYVFFVRKFNSIDSVAPEDLVTGENNFIPLILLRWLIRGQRNIAITGAQKTGKSTFLKMLVGLIPPFYTIRLQELAFELSLRYTYPERNITSLQETSYFSSQEGLNLQKKMNGDVNIIGEVAEAQQSSYIVQTSLVASLFTMFSHHAKTAAALIEAIGNNLLELKLYSNRDDAYSMAAKVINIDCHLENEHGNRHIERITEIIPLSSKPYPSEKESLRPAEEMLDADTQEFYRRTTDRQLFKEVDIIRWEDGKFYLVNMPSDEMISEMKKKFSPQEAAQFEKDMEMLSHYTKEEEGVA